MSRQRLPNGQSDEEYVRAFLRQTKSTEDEYGVLVEVELFYTGRVGVLGIHLVCVECRIGANLSRPIVRYRTEFPGVHARGLAACLFQAAQKVDTMMYDYRKTEDDTRAAKWG